MKPKAIVKIALDILMTIALLLLMGFQFWGDAVHEWIGAGTFVLFIAHHILNRGWYASLFKGKYSPVRVLRLAVDFIVLAAMLGLMTSGIMMSRHVFAFLPINGGLSFARSLHIVASYWGFVLMAFHLGLHWSMVISVLRKAVKLKKSSAARTVALNIIGAGISAYGIYAFVKREFVTYMLLKSQLDFVLF